jgi:lipopolysaccharide export system protein LptA
MMALFKTLTRYNLALCLLALEVTAPCLAVSAPKEASLKLAPAKIKTPLAEKPAAASTPIVTTTPSSSSPVGLGGQDFDISKGPTNISADSLTLFTDKRTFSYQGKVVVVQGDMTLTADTLDGNYSDKNEIEMIYARSNVTIVKGPDIKAGGQKAEYDAKKRIIILTEAPYIEQKGSVLTADIIKVFADENRSVAEGNVKVNLTSTEDLKSVGAP